MESRKTAWIACIAVLILPMVSCQSRGETYHGDRSGQRTESNSRFGGDEAAFITERPTKVPRVTGRPVTKPPTNVFFDTRFDTADSALSKKKLTYDETANNAIEEFSLQLLDTFNGLLPNQNIMISPFAIYNLLMMLAEGADGETYNQLAALLRIRNLPKARDFQQYLKVALDKNTADVILKRFAILLTDKNRPVKDGYMVSVEKIYGGDLEDVDFRNTDETVRAINKKISDLTQGQITDTLMRDDLFKAQMILISGLFFKGQWANIFNKTLTKRETFYDTNGNRAGEVNMMFQRGPLAYAADRDLGCHLLELPYSESSELTSRLGEGEYGSGLSMIVVLPKKGLALEDAIKNVYKHGLRKIFKELAQAKVDYEDEEIEVYLPRFQITSEFDLKTTLEPLGVNNIFEQSLADLSKINPAYYVASMVHKTKLSVDEQGSTAAAVAVSIFANKSTPPKFHANKPFLYFIVDKLTNLILFSGQYVAPELY